MRLLRIIALAVLALPLCAQDAIFRTFDALTATGTTATQKGNLSGGAFVRTHAIEIVPTSTPATCAFTLQRSLDGTNWTTLVTVADCTSTAASDAVDKPARWVRGNLTGLTGTAATVLAAAETLDETDFATHAKWDVTNGFVDSGGNAAFDNQESLDEIDFATHVNWDVTGVIVDSAGNAVFTTPETLVEADFATHVNWDVTDDFDDSGGNAVMTAPEETLSEANFATHANWATVGLIDDTGGNAAYSSPESLAEKDFATHALWDVGGTDMTDSTGAAVYVHSGGTGTLTQASGNMATVGVDDATYTFTYTVSGAAGDPACEITNAFALAAESLTLTDGGQTNTFTAAAAASSADFVISCTSDSGDDAFTIDDVSLYVSTNTLTQASGGFATAAVGSVTYSFAYTMSSFTGSAACDITTAFAASTEALTMADGAQAITFTSKGTPGDFVISCTGIGTATFDDVALTYGVGTLTLPSADFNTAAVGGVTYRFAYTVSSSSGDVACEITTAFAASAESLTVSDGAQVNSFTSTGSPGDFVISCVSSTGAATFDDFALTYGAGTLTQVNADQAIVGVDDADYTFYYTVSSFTGDVACSITNAYALSSTALTMSDGAQSTAFTAAAAASSADFVISCTSSYGNATLDDVSLVTGTTGTLTQTSANLNTAAVADAQYALSYTVSAVSGGAVTCTVTTAFAATSTALTVADGAQTTFFTSAAVPGDFVISCTNTEVTSAATFDDVTLTLQNCTNATPIVVTTSSSHGLSTGDIVTITGAVGNTACNATANAITSVDATHFSLNSVAGNGKWTGSGSIVSVPTVTVSYLGVR